MTPILVSASDNRAIHVQKYSRVLDVNSPL